ncbi:MAG: ABC transporter substrate-binding protein [Infirmifilum sp.]
MCKLRLSSAMAKPGSKKTTLAVAVALIAVVAVIAAYFLLAPKAPRVKNVIVIGTTDNVQTTLDPCEAYDYLGVNIIQNMGEGLFAYEPGTAKLVNKLAVSYTVSPDRKVWDIKIRTDAKFQDGTPLTAQAVVWSWERTIKLNQDPAFLIGDLIEKAEAISSDTVRVYLKQPFEETYVKSLLATWVAFPVNPKTTPMDVVKPPNTVDMIGPYKLASWKPGEYIELVANPNYYGEKPKTERVIIRFYKDAQSLRLAVENGEVDVAFRTLSPADVKDIMAKGALQVVSGPGIAPIRYMVINVNKEPFNDKRVRQAIAYLIDRNQIVNTVYMGTFAQPLYSMVPIGFLGHKDSFKERYGDKPNVQAARQLLVQAGFSESNPLKMELWYTPVRYTPAEPDIAAIIKQNLEASGMIKVDLKSADWATYRSLFKQEKIAVWLLGWFPDFLDSDNYVRPFYHSGANGWLHVNYQNPTIDKLIDEQVLQPTEQRIKTLAQIQDIAAEDAPIIPLWQEGQFAVAQKNVKGIVLDYSQIFRYWLIYAEVSG